jgi:hypothetical protein
VHRLDHEPAHHAWVRVQGGGNCGWFLLALPPKFEQIAVTIETLLGLESISVDELIARLKPSEERINRNGGKSIASLNLMEDELVAQLSSRLKVSVNGVPDHSKESSSSNNKHGRGKGCGTGSQSGNRGGESSGGRGGETLACVVVRALAMATTRPAVMLQAMNAATVVRGHWTRECPKKNQDEEVHAMQAEEEDEPTLFMVSATVIEPIPDTVHLDESKLFVQLGMKGGGDNAL